VKATSARRREGDGKLETRRANLFATPDLPFDRFPSLVGAWIDQGSPMRVYVVGTIDPMQASKDFL